jgi:putative CocE/NonD family hydrolase
MPIREAVIGPWDHEGTANASPLRTKGGVNTTVELDSVVSFFTRHLSGADASGHTRARRVSWFVAGTESWRTSEWWPTTRARTWRVGAAGTAARLVDATATAPAVRTADTLRVDYRASTGTHNRWTSGLARRVDAPDRANAVGLLSWQTAPVTERLAVFGAGEFICTVQLDAPDAALHVYVESVDHRGRVRLLTEGIRRITALETRAGEVSVRIRPVAFELPVAWALRLSVAGADAGTFERVPVRGAQQIRVTDCRLVLPVTDQ